MIQFNIGGQYLELPADFDLQFQKKNILFAFDKIECERSTSFDIPDTPKNNAIFKVAKNVAYKGEGMRRRYEAQMQAGVVVKNGYLYVDTYEKGSYKAVFVTGELLGLLVLKNAGNFEDILLLTDSVQYGGTPVSSRTNGKSLSYKNVQYRSYIKEFVGKDNVIYPSFLLSQLTCLALDKLGVTRPAVTDMPYCRFVKGSLNKLTVKLGIRSTKVAPSVEDQQIINETQSDFSTLLAPSYVPYNETDWVVIDEGTYKYWDWVGIRQDVGIAGFRAMTDLIITFPEDMPRTVVAATEVFSAQSTQQTYGLLMRLLEGGEVRQQTLQPTTRPLAGRDVAVAAGQSFTLIDLAQLHSLDASSREAGDIDQAYFFAEQEQVASSNYLISGQPSYAYNVKASEEQEPSESGTVYLQPNLPEMTPVQALKILASIQGKVLNYEDAQGVFFDDLEDGWETVEIKDILSATKVKRTFGDYAQNNLVRYDSEDRVKNKLQVNYKIGNENIDNSKDLLVIPFSEGGTFVEQNSELSAMVYDEEDGGSSADYLFDGDTPNDEYMQRCVLGKNNIIQQLCDQSTSVEVSCLMSIVEYEAIKTKTRLLYDGCEWVWTEAQYSKGVAKLVMSKI